MMDHDDFEEINRLLERSCDHCMLSRLQCTGCRIEKLRGIVGQFCKSGPFEVLLVKLDELRVLLELAREAGGDQHKVVIEWEEVLKETAGKEITA